ncbi:hypothetical protein [Nocardia tengchongensis]
MPKPYPEEFRRDVVAVIGGCEPAEATAHIDGQVATALDPFVSSPH